MDNLIAKTRTVKIAGREFTLAFTLRSMIALQKEADVFDFDEVNRFISKPEGLLDALYVLADDGERLNGRRLDVDKEWFALHIPANVRKFISLQIAVMKTMAEGMDMESLEKDEDAEVDLVLQEIQKKSVKTNSPGEKSQPGDSSQD